MGPLVRRFAPAALQFEKQAICWVLQRVQLRHEDIINQVRLDLNRRRVNVIKRIDHAITTSEADVLATGESITSLLHDARTQAAEARKTLELVDQDSDLAVAITSQTKAMESYIGHLTESLGAQQTIATEAATQSQQIANAVQQIAKIARATKILNVNAQIEAGRMGDSGKAFTVIADEMASLSRDVESTNAMISELADTLLGYMPQIEDMTNEAVEGANQFSRRFAILQRDVVRVEKEMRAEYKTSVQEAERIATHTLDVAHTALSRLQFQDPMAQSLAKIKVECEAMEDLVETAQYEIKLDTLGEIEASGGSAYEYGSYYLEKQAESMAKVAAEKARREVLEAAARGELHVVRAKSKKRKKSRGTETEKVPKAANDTEPSKSKKRKSKKPKKAAPEKAAAVEASPEVEDAGDVLLFDGDDGDASGATDNEAVDETQAEDAGDVLLFGDDDDAEDGSDNAENEPDAEEDTDEAPEEAGDVLLFAGDDEDEDEAAEDGDSNQPAEVGHMLSFDDDDDDGDGDEGDDGDDQEDDGDEDDEDDEDDEEEPADSGEVLLF